ncbi:MAG: hypothetical protein HY300_01850, partial [Verrucomicrobia bacterium]|nr:hypothetical protein [Verrucomicrobiota bacterium]
MRIFFVASVIPRKPHDTRAPNVVVNEAIEAFVQLGHEVVLQLIFPEPQRGHTDAEVANIRRLTEQFGVRVLPFLWLDDVPQRASDWLLTRLGLNYGVRRFHPFYELCPEIVQRVRDCAADVSFSLWSPPALPACAEIRDVPKCIYYGNPDYKPDETRAKNPWLFDQRPAGWLQRFKAARRLAAQKKWFFGLMQCHDLVWNVCDVDAQLIRDHGVPHSQYMQNMWPIPLERDCAALRR